MFDLGNGGYCLIENNLCFNNGGSGINVLDGEALVVNNTLFRNGWDSSQRWKHEISIQSRYIRETVENVIVTNNVIWARFGVPVASLESEETVFDNNLCWSDRDAWMIILPESGTHNIVSEPLFSDVALDNALKTLYNAPFIDMQYDEYDFHLHPSSPALGKSIEDYSPAIDLKSRSRPAGNGSDLGALEFIPVEDGYRICDLNGDGMANIIDALQLLLIVREGKHNIRADLDGDGAIGIDDVIAALRYIATGNR